jgi:hypothetical protein
VIDPAALQVVLGVLTGWAGLPPVPQRRTSWTTF